MTSAPLPLLHHLSSLLLALPTTPPADISEAEVTNAITLVRAAPSAALEVALRTWLPEVTIGHEAEGYAVVDAIIFPPAIIPRQRIMHVLHAITGLGVGVEVGVVVETIERTASE